MFSILKLLKRWENFGLIFVLNQNRLGFAIKYLKNIKYDALNVIKSQR